jgi:hypothetical protein
VDKPPVTTLEELAAYIRDGVNRLIPHSETFEALHTELEMQKEAERIAPKAS